MEIKEQIQEQLDKIESLLLKNYDIYIKLKPDGNVKITYFEPKNIRKER